MSSPLSHRFLNMKMLSFMCTILITIILISPALADSNDSSRHFYFNLESGPVWQSRNDVQIPNDQNGTRFSLVDLVDQGPYAAVRLYVTWRINERNDLRILLAPLSYTEKGSFASPVAFAGENYNPGEPLDATYKFNSWRLTYRYKIYHGEQWHWWLGFTAKIRDAKIELKQNNVTSKKTDLGFVPLLHLRGEYNISDQWWVLLDVDALAGGPGRAIDGTVQVGYNFSEHWGVSAGYRTVEGGADVDEVYNFAWLHYAVVSINYQL